MVAVSLDGLVVDSFSTPIGEALLVTDEHGRLCAFTWQDRASRLQAGLPKAAQLKPGRAPLAVREALQAYFDGELGRLGGIACAAGGAPVERAGWAGLAG